MSHLLKLGYVDEPTLEAVLVDLFEVPYADAARLRCAPEEAIRALSAKDAQRFRCCPVDVEGNTLAVAMLNPRDGIAIGKLRRSTGYDIEPCIVLEYRLDLALRRHYGLPSMLDTQGISLEPSQLPGAGPAPQPAVEPAPPTNGRSPGIVEDGVGLDGLPMDAELRPEGFQREDWRDAAAIVESRMAKLSIDEADAHDGEGGLERLATDLFAATSKEDIAQAILAHCESLGSRRALFSAGPNGLKAILGFGEGWHGDGVTLESNPALPPVWTTAVGANGFYFGICPPTPPNRAAFEKLWGTVPDMVLILPIFVKGRLVALLHIDDGPRAIESPPIQSLRRACLKTGLAFEILLLRGKLRNC